MNRKFVSLFALCSIALLLVSVALAQIKVAPIRTTASIIKPITVSRLGVVNNQALGNLTALTEINGKMYGAGANFVAIIGENGAASKTIRTNISKAAGIATHSASTLIIGDSSANTISVFNIGSEKTTPLLNMKNVRYNPQKILAGDVMTSGVMSSIASDGQNIYVAYKAGYSSSIFKINPKTQQVLAHSWSPGPDPDAMTFANNKLFILDGSGKKIRHLDSNLILSHEWIDINVQEGKGLIIRGDEIKVLSPKAKSIIKMKPLLSLATLQVTRLKINKSIAAAAVEMFKQPQKYAVLICGDVAESGYDEFWNDTCWMYKTLRDAGYRAQNIYVLYGNGNDYISGNPKYQTTERVTDFPATVTWVNKVFDGLKNGDAANGIMKMKDNDTLFLWTFDHGAGDQPAYLCLMDGGIADTNFANKLNAVPYANRAIFMQQCRSGGFIDDLQNSKTFISTACRSHENASRSDSENEYYNNKWYHHGEYNYYIICALNGKTPAGTTVNADSNNNGKLSMREAHAWHTTHENESVVPQMNDMGNVGLNFHIK